MIGKRMVRMREELMMLIMLLILSLEVLTFDLNMHLLVIMSFLISFTLCEIFQLIDALQLSTSVASSTELYTKKFLTAHKNLIQNPPPTNQESELNGTCVSHTHKLTFSLISLDN